MKYSEFMAAIVDIYGPYRSAMLEQLTARYVRNRFGEQELERALTQLTLKRSARYKTPPDPAEFEEIFFRKDGYLEAEALKWWMELNRKINSRCDCIISDLRVQAAVDVAGGWVAFCTRVIRDENGRDIDVWNRKQFVDLFKLYSSCPPDIEVKIFRGIYDDRSKIVMIGDEARCRELIKERKQAGMQLVNEMVSNMKLSEGGHDEPFI